MEEILKCKLCNCSYNTEERQPYIIKCGHTFCKFCISGKQDDLLCPLCGISLSFLFENCILNKIVEEMLEKFCENIVLVTGTCIIC
jgi:hypothetical protein